VVRAALEHALVDRGEIQRLYYSGPMFRYERPQKGRYRQFSQIGAEVFGSASPATDAEVMQMALALFEGLGLEGTRLQINSVGHPGCRETYKARLRAFFEPRREALCEDCRRRLDTNPLRILDCKVPSCAPVREGAPSILDSLCEDCRAHFDAVRAHLDQLGVPAEVNSRLVRGLDYYTRTTFEITAAGLGAQDALCGGGRYDDLVGSMGGPSVPGFGFAIGTDRLVLALSSAPPEEPAPDVFVVHRGAKTLDEGLLAATRLRGAGLVVRLEPDARDVKKQMSRAAASNARYVLIIGERELEEGTYALKRMSDGTQQSIAARRWDRIEQEVRDGQ
jgi:histidyl-tRNA synthetase